MVFNPVIQVYATPEELSRAGCKAILDIVGTTNCELWPMSIALSGGSTPKMMYENLHKNHLELLKEKRPLRFFFGDERLVPADAADSNYNMAREALLHGVPEDLVVPVDVSSISDASTPGCADAIRIAAAYEQQIASLLPLRTLEGSKKTVPVFDIVLLGLGSDGHTASIFPGSQAEELDGAHCAVSVAFPSKTMNPKVWRVTLTPTSIVHARNVIVLATGEEKKWVLEGILADAPARVPVARFIRSCAGKVVFLLDKNISQGLVP